MKRIGLIDNLPGLDAYRRDGFQEGDGERLFRAVGGNTGNLAYVFGVEKMLGDAVERVDWGWPPEELRRRCDHLVVCCANQLGAHVELDGWADRLRAFGLPVTLIGLGAQADDFDRHPELPPGTHRFLEVVGGLRPAAGAPNIAVRGEFTRQLLERLGIEGVVTGCPSLMISPNRRLGAELVAAQRHGPFERVAAAAGNPWHARSAPLERRLVDLVEFRDGGYVLQHPAALIHLALGEGERVDRPTIDHLLALYDRRFDEPELRAWFPRHAHLFVDAPNWMRFLRHFDVVVGPRYHGVALGVQAGVPGCVVTIDSRTRELCESTAIKALWIDEALALNPMQLAERGRWDADDGARLDATRAARARRYVEFLGGNGLATTPHLDRLAGEAATP